MICRDRRKAKTRQKQVPAGFADASHSSISHSDTGRHSLSTRLLSGNAGQHVVQSVSSRVEAALDGSDGTVKRNAHFLQ